MMKIWRNVVVTVMAAVTIVFVFFQYGANARDYPDRPSAPEFPHSDPTAWINSQPLTLPELRGQVIMLDIWTFDCWNCYRSFPWLNLLEDRFSGQGLKVIGIHTPEFEHERKRENIVAKVVEFGLHHPVMIDNDFAYWHALKNRYWPTFYLIDKSGRLRSVFIGETHADSRQALIIEKTVETLLAE